MIIIIIWREDIWATLWKMKSILLGGKGGGADIPRSEINIEIDFPGQEEKYLFCEKFPFFSLTVSKRKPRISHGKWDLKLHLSFWNSEDISLHFIILSQFVFFFFFH